MGRVDLGKCVRTKLYSQYSDDITQKVVAKVKSRLWICLIDVITGEIWAVGERVMRDQIYYDMYEAESK